MLIDKQKNINILHPFCLLLLYILPQACVLVTIIATCTDLSAFYIVLISGLSCWLLAVIVYTIFSWIKSIPIHLLVCPLTLVFGITYLLLLCFFLFLISPYYRIPPFLFFIQNTEQLFLFVLSLFMPSLIHATFLGAKKSLDKQKKRRSWLNFLGALAIPISFYVLYRVILPLLVYSSEYSLLIQVFFILATGMIFLFFFLLLRGLWIIKRKISRFKKISFILKGIITIVIPLLGLLINNYGLQFLEFSITPRGVFGNFYHPLYYILVIFTGICLTLPDPANKYIRILLFFLHLLALPFSVYIFITLLPFIPLAPVFAVFFGLGLFLLSPLFVLIIHIKALIRDIKYLTIQFSRAILLTAGAFALLILPAVVMINLFWQKTEVQKIINYVFYPDYKQEKINFNPQAIKPLITDSWNSPLLSFSTPLFTSLQNWLVFENKELTYKNRWLLQNLFFRGESFYNNQILPANTNQVNDDQNWVKIQDMKIHSVFDKQEQYWKSTIDLTLVNGEIANNEFFTIIHLPDGVWVSDYYLQIGTEREHGEIREKRAAIWVYKRIVAQKRDPGLLYYLDNNHLVLKVFPFAPNEQRYTGLELIHPQPAAIRIGTHNLCLGQDYSLSQIQSTREGNTFYIPKSVKQTLPRVQRTPYYHFILDCSAEKEYYYKQYIANIINLTHSKPINSEKARISFVDYKIVTYEMADPWQEKLMKKAPVQGGFFLDRALKKIVLAAYYQHKNTYPVIVVLSPNIYNCIFISGLAGISYTYPESDYYYHMDTNGILYKYSFLYAPQVQGNIRQEVENIEINEVRLWSGFSNLQAYLPDNDEPVIIQKQAAPFNLATQEKSMVNKWQAGLELYGTILSKALYPYSAKDGILPTYQFSKQSNILSQETAFIVLENDDQRQIIDRAEKDNLKEKGGFQPGGSSHSMSEPAIVIGLLLVLIIIIIRGFWLNNR